MGEDIVCGGYKSFSHPKPLSILPRSAEGGEGFEDFLDVVGFGPGEVLGEVGGGNGGLGGVEGGFDGADAFRPHFVYGVYSLMPLSFLIRWNSVARTSLATFSAPSARSGSV